MKELLNNPLLEGFRYDEAHGALIGQMKGYTAAIRENNRTGSYGCLMWVRKSDYGSSEDITDKLKQMMNSESSALKNFKATDRGIAAAFAKTGDTDENAGNINKTLGELTAELEKRSYVSCCYDCGDTDDLAVYDSAGVLIQACGKCGAKYKLVMKPEPETIPDLDIDLSLDTDTSGLKDLGSEKKALFEAMATAAASVKEPQSEDDISMEDLLSDPMELDSEAHDDDRTTIDTKNDLADFSSLMFDAPAQKTPSASDFGVYDEPKKNIPRKKDVDEDLSSLLFVEGDKKDEGLQLKSAEPVKIGHDRNVAVTELRDDSNDGEDIEVTEYKDTTDYGKDFDIEAIDTYVNKPTNANEGKKLEANETPLEADGSVPLINPTSNFVDRTISAVDGEDAVEPFDIRESIGGGDEMRSVGAKGGMNRRPAPAPKSPDIPPEALYPLPQRVDKISFGSDAVFGIMGAFVLGIIGVVVWSLLTGLGDKIPGRIGTYISCAGCFAISIGVFFGYYIGGEELDGKGMAISTVFTILFDIIGLGIRYATMVITGMRQLGYNMSYLDSIEWIVYAFTQSENRASLYFDVGLNLFLMVGALLVAISYVKKRN